MTNRWYVLQIHRETGLIVRSEADADKLRKPYTPVAGPYETMKQAKLVLWTMVKKNREFFIDLEKLARKRRRRSGPAVTARGNGL